MERLSKTLQRIDGRGYPQYKSIKGKYDLGGFDLEILHVQGDPFAAPSRILVRVPHKDLKIRLTDIHNPSRRLGLEDAIYRDFRELGQAYSSRRGSGKSGLWGFAPIGQEMLWRSCCEIDEESIEFRLSVGLPANGRRILGREAEDLLIGDLQDMVDDLFEADQARWKEHMDSSEDQNLLRAILVERNWLSFIGNGCLLPRRSGVSDRPLDDPDAVRWKSPPELEQEVELPNIGKIVGSAIPEGVHLICGGGYHGKSTLLQAISRAIYNHIPGDGREWMATISDAVQVRAEDGRSIYQKDISGFINGLPNGQDTTQFSSRNASGSTSQAANIVEAIQSGARCLLIDEDTSATNFMVRDRRMQELVETSKEPITPFVDRVRELADNHRVSTLMVVGGAGDYFEVADQVIVMDKYHPSIQTDRAKSAAKEFPSNRLKEERPRFKSPASTCVDPKSLDPKRGRRDKVRTSATRSIQFGSEEIDVSLIDQLVDSGQTRTIADWLLKLSQGQEALDPAEASQTFENLLSAGKISSQTHWQFGDRVFCRRFELAAALHRLRSLK